MSSTTPLILLIAGWSSSGKDATAKILVETYDFKRYAFADAIKEHVAKHNDIPLEWCYDQERKASPFLPDSEKTLREEIIEMAEKGREKHKEHWARDIAQKIKKHSSSLEAGEARFIISDWRHIEELFALQKVLPKALLLPIRITRHSQILSPVPDKTEYSLLGFPFWHTIENNGSLTRLTLTIGEFMEGKIEPLLE